MQRPCSALARRSLPAMRVLAPARSRFCRAICLAYFTVATRAGRRRHAKRLRRSPRSLFARFGSRCLRPARLRFWCLAMCLPTQPSRLLAIHLARSRSEALAKVPAAALARAALGQQPCQSCARTAGRLIRPPPCWLTRSAAVLKGCMTHANLNCSLPSSMIESLISFAKLKVQATAPMSAATGRCRYKVAVAS